MLNQPPSGHQHFDCNCRRRRCRGRRRRRRRLCEPNYKFVLAFACGPQTDRPLTARHALKSSLSACRRTNLFNNSPRSALGIVYVSGTFAGGSHSWKNCLPVLGAWCVSGIGRCRSASLAAKPFWRALDCVGWTLAPIFHANIFCEKWYA